MPDVSAEQVLVVPTQLLHTLGYFQGFLPGVAGYLDRLLSPQHTSYRPRAAMEADPQLQTTHPVRDFLPHRRGRRTWVFRYTRGTGQGEQRLHRKQSVGIGGHISSDDAGGSQPYAEGMRRELDEEVSHQHVLHGSLRGLDQRR